MTININTIEPAKVKRTRGEKAKIAVFLSFLATLAISGIVMCIIALKLSAQDEPIVQKLKYNQNVREMVGNRIERRALLSPFCQGSDKKCSAEEAQHQFIINGTKGSAKVEYIVDSKSNSLVYLNVKGVWGTEGDVLIVDNKH